jgi:hypothetical protein
MPCPDSNKEEEFSVVNNSPITCNVMHLRTDKHVKKKYFLSGDSAFLFYKRAKEQSNSSNYVISIESVKIDSIFIDNINLQKMSNK